MPLNQKELQKLVKFCRKNGVSKIKTTDFEIEISLSTPCPKKEPGSTVTGGGTEPGIPSFDQLSDMQRILWSSTPMNEGMGNADH